MGRVWQRHGLEANEARYEESDDERPGGATRAVEPGREGCGKRQRRGHPKRPQMHRTERERREEKAGGEQRFSDGELPRRPVASHIIHSVIP